MADGWLLPQLAAQGVALLGTALVVNGVLTFAGALAFALLAARWCGSARLAKYLSLLPFLRVCWELVRGAPPGAYVLSDYAGTKGALGSFQVGVGASVPLSPIVRAGLEMQQGGVRYAYSAGDALAHGVFRELGPFPLLLLLAVLVSVSTALLVVRLRAHSRFRARLAGVRERALGSECVLVGRRSVEVITMRSGELGAFTSGVLAPRVWLPAELTGRDREAVLEHELAHVRDHDVFWFALAGALADVFWFVPGARYLERRFRERAEEAADARALARGVEPRRLAENILAGVEVAGAGAPAARMRGTARHLERRLRSLAARPAESKQRRLLRAVLALSLAASALRSVFFGYL